MKKLIAGILLAIGIIALSNLDATKIAWAQVVQTVKLADFTGAFITPTNPLPVTLESGSASLGYVGGYDSGAATATATPANSSHAAGQSIGGLFSVAIARTNGGSGIVTQFLWKSTNGSTGSAVVRIWQKSPANTTCTDNSAFVGSDTDDAFLITTPFTITPVAPAVTTGDAATYAAQPALWDYKNVDTSPGTNLYVCVVTVATDTADDNKLVRVTMSGPQN